MAVPSWFSGRPAIGRVVKPVFPRIIGRQHPPYELRRLPGVPALPVGRHLVIHVGEGRAGEHVGAGEGWRLIAGRPRLLLLLVVVLLLLLLLVLLLLLLCWPLRGPLGLGKALGGVRDIAGGGTGARITGSYSCLGQGPVNDIQEPFP